MRHDDHANIEVAHDFGQKIVQPLAVRPVEVARRLVSQNNAGMCRERARDCRPLLFATAQLTGPMVQPGTQPNALEKRSRAQLRRPTAIRPRS